MRGACFRGFPLGDHFAGCVLGAIPCGGCVSSPEGQHSRADAGFAGGVLRWPDRIGPHSRKVADSPDCMQHAGMLHIQLSWPRCMLGPPVYCCKA